MPFSRAMVAFATIVLAWTSEVALACPSCASPLEENRQAFVDTTIFLSVVPLMLIGGLIWWLRRKVRAMDEADAEIPVHETLLRDASRFSKGP